jgi:hypothetical protein
MTDWVAIGVSLLGGSIGGLAVAPLSTQRQELGRDRYRARQLLGAELKRYRDQLKYDHGGPLRKHAYPLSYAGIELSERLTEAVVKQLPVLRKRLRDDLHRDLMCLVGGAVLDIAAERVYLPQEARDVQEEARRLEVADRHVLLEAGVAEQYGLVGVVRRSQNEPDHQRHYEEALQVLDRMIGRVL